MKGRCVEVSGTGRGKLLLFGEHAAVYGYPAVGLSLPSGTAATLRFAPPIFGPPPYSGETRFEDCVNPQDRDVLLRLLRTVRTLLSARCGGSGTTLPMPRSVQVVSDLPRGLGFGSSAALCVSSAIAFARFAACVGAVQSLCEEETWFLAHQAERIFHTVPSGVDTGLALFPGVHLLRPAPRPAEAVPAAEALPSAPLHVVTGAVPRRSDTRSLIRSIRGRLAGGERWTSRLLERLGGISGEAAALIRSGSEADALADGLGGLADEAQRHLRELGLSSPDLERMLEAGKSAGATGGKLSGAGGGGAFYLVARSEAHAGAIASRLHRFRTEDGGGPLLFGPLPVSLSGGRDGNRG